MRGFLTSCTQAICVETDKESRGLQVNTPMLRQAGRQLEVEPGAARCAALDVMLSGQMCSDRHKIKMPAGERTYFQARCVQTDKD